MTKRDPITALWPAPAPLMDEQYEELAGEPLPLPGDDGEPAADPYDDLARARGEAKAALAAQLERYLGPLVARLARHRRA